MPKWVNGGDCCEVRGEVTNNTGRDLRNVVLEFDAYTGQNLATNERDSLAVLGVGKTWAYRVGVPAVGYDRVVTKMQPGRLTFAGGKVDLAGTVPACNVSIGRKC